ncbi:MAG: YckD family protein [Chloroflexi bacterium]|nr:YckD family protein [Chloroflexota bacterium]
MNRLAVIAISALAGVGLLAGTAGTSFAAGPTPTPPANPPRVWQGGAGPGFARGFGYQTMHESITGLLGMSSQEIHDQRLAGKSLAQIAQSKGVDVDKLVSTILASRKQALDERVKAGVITQAQADQAYQFMQERITANVNRTEVGPNRPTDPPHVGPGLGPGAGRGYGEPGSGTGPGLFHRWAGQSPAGQ